MSDIHGVIGPYVVHAILEAERRRFESHLAECGVCAREVIELSETITRLSLLSAASPPPGLRQAVLSRIGDTLGAGGHSPTIARDDKMHVGRLRAAGDGFRTL